LPAAPAQAAAARTFVSATGSDSNNCANVATPCRHLAAAYAATAANGEIYVLDPANYGALTITGPVSIEGHGWASIAPVAGQAAITINANAGDKINIIGVVLDGTALANTLGIQFNFGGSLTVRDSVIRNFGNDGIFFGQGLSNTTSQLFISNTLVSDNVGYGIVVDPSGSGTTNSVLSHVRIENNISGGLLFTTSAQTINVTVADSVSANNGANGSNPGIYASSNGGTQVSVMVRNSTIANNAMDGLQASGTGATIRVTRSTITGNNTGWAVSSNGVVLSYGDNNIDGNTNVNTEPPNPLTYK
jgi:Right handed beta helix region